MEGEATQEDGSRGVAVVTALFSVWNRAGLPLFSISRWIVLRQNFQSLRHPP